MVRTCAHRATNPSACNTYCGWSRRASLGHTHAIDPLPRASCSWRHTHLQQVSQPEHVSCQELPNVSNGLFQLRPLRVNCVRQRRYRLCCTCHLYIAPLVRLQPPQCSAADRKAHNEAPRKGARETRAPCAPDVSLRVFCARIKRIMRSGHLGIQALHQLCRGVAA